jgi:hypothetical protein
MGRQTNTGFEHWRRLTRLRFAGHPLFTCGGKSGLNNGYYNIEKNQIVNFQTPLSGKAEERVAGVASPGESSTPGNLHHFYFGFSHNLKTPLLFLFYLMLLTFVLASCTSNQTRTNQIHIALTADKRSLNITGLDNAIVQDINRDSLGGNWQSLVPVYKMPADTDLKNYQPVQPGKYIVKDSVVVFIPDTPFIARQTYFVRYYNFDANNKASDYILGHNKLGSLPYTDLIFKQ